MKKYFEQSGLFWAEGTPQKVMDIIIMAKMNNWRLRLSYGDVKTGRDWKDKYDTTGYIGNSTGWKKIPILVHNRRSMGGSAILTDCIVKICFANRRTAILKNPLYIHPLYH